MKLFIGVEWMMGSVGISSSVSAVLQGLECVFFFGGGGVGG